ncbi:serine hydrolase [Rhodococcus phage Reynauld]|uniref:Serine hydrolase n=1 Tax=Rhodococcus phage Reynauld TaxID=3062845 RepID=A0ACD4UHK0_9CAUD|nr:serine hydrolase [Rhodococcus phage Reynauld]
MTETINISKVYILVCRGIGEKPGDHTMLVRGLRKWLPDGAYEIREILWKASYGIVPELRGSSYAAGLEEGMGLIHRELASLPPLSRAFLVGYSAGATLAGNWIANGHQWVARNVGPANAFMWRLLGVGLLADPMRPEGGGCPAYTAPGFGIGGPRPVPAGDFPVWWLSDPRDPICSLERNSPLRTVADQTFAMSFDPGEFPAWIADLRDRLKERRFQPVEIPWWDPVAVVRQYLRAKDDLDGYLWRGEHVQYETRLVPGTVTTYLELLAVYIMKATRTADPYYLERAGV